MSTEREVIICPSCGARYDTTQYRCPYCGTLTPDGAETEYMDGMEQIKDEMEEMPEKELANGKTILKSQLKRVLIYFIGLLTALGILYAVCRAMDDSNKMKVKEEIINEIGRSQTEYEEVQEGI
ncbi:MAG: hypothetical protein EOM40_17575 [Clostridia bacterium]|nr:hypothetical protein [Clostridia bacterium]NCC43290.1 hypothetical protein [Clostridia bacterium]